MTHWIVCCVCCARALTFLVVLCVFENLYLALSAARCTIEILEKSTCFRIYCVTWLQSSLFRISTWLWAHRGAGVSRRSRCVHLCLMCCSVLQRVAVCCSVLQWGVVWLSVLQWGAGVSRCSQCCHLYLMCCSLLQCAAVCYSVLRCVAVFYSVLQCVAVCCSVSL